LSLSLLRKELLLLWLRVIDITTREGFVPIKPWLCVPVNNAALTEDINSIGAEKINNIDNIENNITEKALFGKT